MNRRSPLLVTLLSVLCVAHITEIIAAETQYDYVEQVLTGCARQLFELALCLREDKSTFTKIRLCDESLTKTFLCMSKTPEEVNLHALQEQEVVVKRGLGRCIHKCLQGQGRMNFIQCKSMCHK